MGNWSGHMGGWWWLAVPMMIVFWTFIVWAVIVLLRANDSTRGRTSAEEVLAERFARGEIDEAEYQRRRKIVRT